MLIIELLTRLPHDGGLLVGKKIVTNAGTGSEAAAQAYGAWTTLAQRENHRAEGFQIVDQDGRMVIGPRFLEEGAPAA